MMTGRAMTLLEAIDSLEFMEVTAVSWINVVPLHTHHVAFFTIAYVLPFSNTKLSDEYRAGSPRFWPDQKRLLKSQISIQDQILELDRSRSRSSGDNAIFENLAGSPMVASRLPLRSNHTNVATGIGVLGT